MAKINKTTIININQCTSLVFVLAKKKQKEILLKN